MGRSWDRSLRLVRDLERPLWWSKRSPEIAESLHLFHSIGNRSRIVGAGAFSEVLALWSGRGRFLLHIVTRADLYGGADELLH